MKKRSILLFFIFSILACTNQTIKQEKKPILYLTIPVGEVQQINMSGIISEHKIIKLEFTAQSMIGDIRKIVIHNEQIYILDTFGAKSIMVFNMDGKFIRRIGTNGKGPGQYLLPKDFIIDTTRNEIEIIDNQRINIYSLNGEFKRNYKINFGSQNYVKLNDNYFFSTGEREIFFIYKTDCNFLLKKKYIPKAPKAFLMDGYRPFIKIDSNHLLFWSMTGDTIYSLSHKNVNPFRFVDFGKYQFRYGEYLAMTFEEKANMIMHKSNINQCLIVRYVESGDYIHIVYNMSSKFYEYIYNKETHKEIHFDREHITDDVTWEKDSWYLIGGDNEYFYYMIQPYKYKSTKQLRMFLESFTTDEEYIQEMLHETSNPIILLAKYKI